MILELERQPMEDAWTVKAATGHDLPSSEEDDD